MPPVRLMRIPTVTAIAAALVAIGLSGCGHGGAGKSFTVAYAGSMGVVMDRDIGPAFAAANGCRYQGIGRGAWGLARQIAAKSLPVDVYISITSGPMRFLQKRGAIKTFLPIASTQMALIYNAKSKFAPRFALAAKAGSKAIPWYRLLRRPGVRFGRTDPRTDPQGRAVVFTMLLAAKFYHQPALARAILGPLENPAQIFTEASLLSRLKDGQIDATCGYESGAVSSGLPYLALPAAINLSNPRYRNTYRQVHFALPTRHGAPKIVRPDALIFYAAIPADAPDRPLAKRFLMFLRSAKAKVMFKNDGYGTHVEQ